jgi:hypothetical protein
MSAPALIYFAVVLGVVAIGMVYNAVQARLERKRARVKKS